MIAIEISSYGEPEVLKPVERPIPEPGPGELVIRVEAAGVARADLLQRQGKYAPPPGASEIPGLDVAGTIHSVGAGAEATWKAGDRVCAILSGGGYAEYCRAPAVQVLPLPEGWTAVEAATLPENLFTVYDILITKARLNAGEIALIHGGSSGIGATAIQLVQAWGATALATAGSPEKCAACLALGAVRAIDYRRADFVAEVRAFASGGVNVILDMVGSVYLDRNLDALALDGRLGILASLSGAKAELDIAKLMKKRAQIIGSMMRARTAQEKGRVASGVFRDIWPMLPAKRAIKPVIDSVFPLAEAWKAHQRMESGSHTGKIILVAS